MEMADGNIERRKLEMVRETLRQFMEERKLNSANGSTEPEMDEDLLLSRLLSKLDSVQPAPESNDSTLEVPVNKHDTGSNSTTSENKKEEVIDPKQMPKDIKIIKRQNRITHNLLSALIVVTMIWQFGEVSVILAVKEKFSHPVRSIGDMIKGAFTGKAKKSLLEGSPSLDGPLLLGGPDLTITNGSFPLLTTK